MLQIDPLELTTINADHYQVSFACLDGKVSYTFGFHDAKHGRSMDARPNEYIWATEEDATAACWLEWSLFAFDEARQLGVKVPDKDYCILRPSSTLATGQDQKGRQTYCVVFECDGERRAYTFTITGNDEQETAAWKHGSCIATWDQSSFNWLMAERKSGSDAILQSVLQFHQAKFCRPYPKRTKQWAPVK